MRVESLVLEVTRRCNMCCEHCLRGDAQELNMTREIVDRVLDNIDEINQVTFTGGEPTLNLPIIEYFFERAEKLGKMPKSFYVATNGKLNQEHLATLLLKQYPKMEEKEMCGVGLSIDIYHMAQNDDDSMRDYDNSILKGLSFYTYDKENPRAERPERGVIPEGRARDWGENHYRKLHDQIKISDDVIEMLYVAANGNLIGDCDFSYDHIDQLSEYDVWGFEELKYDYKTQLYGD